MRRFTDQISKNEIDKAKRSFNLVDRYFGEQWTKNQLQKSRHRSKAMLFLSGFGGAISSATIVFFSSNVIKAPEILLYR